MNAKLKKDRSPTSTGLQQSPTPFTDMTAAPSSPEKADATAVKSAGTPPRQIAHKVVSDLQTSSIVSAANLPQNSVVETNLPPYKRQKMNPALTTDETAAMTPESDSLRESPTNSNTLVSAAASIAAHTAALTQTDTATAATPQVDTANDRSESSKAAIRRAESDLSSSSGREPIDRQQFCMSPVLRSKASHEVPPAPPSTPASNVANQGTLSWDMATPMPTDREDGYVRNTALLEQEVMLGAETPAPPRPDQQAKNSYARNNKRPLPEDFSDWAVGDRYELLRILGRGSYGEVAQAVDKYANKTDAFVAIKRITSPFDQEVDAIRLYREMHILRSMRGHDCIIQLVDVVQPPTDDLDDFHDLYLVFEYVDTDLYKLIMSPQYLTTEHVQTFLYQILTGLVYIHSMSVIHRDMKPANILLNEDCSLKICDFGLARIVDRDTMHKAKDVTESGGILKSPNNFGIPPKLGLTRQLTKHVVTRWYRAPELILVQPYTSAVDIWSLGCILAELLSMQDGNVAGYQDRKPLFPGGTCFPLSGEGEYTKSDEKLDQLSVIFGVIGTPPKEDVESIGKASEYVTSLGKIEGKSLGSLFPAADKDAIDLLEKMLQFNPKKRCTAAEALDHAFLRNVRRKEMESVATKPLECPQFLESNKIDISLLKQQVFTEVLHYRDKGLPSSFANPASSTV